MFQQLGGDPGRGMPPGGKAYVGKDGLLYCSVCRRPLEKKISLPGYENIVSCLCRCGQEELEEEEAKQRKREKEIEISHLKAAGIQEKYLRDEDAADETK